MLTELLKETYSGIGVCTQNLMEKLNLNEQEFEQLLIKAKSYNLNFLRVREDDKSFILLDKKHLWKNIPLSAEDILEFIQASVFSQFSETLKNKIQAAVPSTVLNVILQENHDIRGQIANFRANKTYSCRYYSRKSKRINPRQFIFLKSLRIGNQYICEAYDLAQKVVRWYDYARIISSNELSVNHLLPQIVRRYLFRAELSFPSELLGHIKWTFRDVMLSYSKHSAEIFFAEKELIDKELAVIPDCKMQSLSKWKPDRSMKR